MILYCQYAPIAGSASNTGNTAIATAAIAALSNHFCMPISTRVPPVSGVTLIVSAADSPVMSRNVLDFRLQYGSRRYVHRLNFKIFVEQIAKLGHQFDYVGFDAWVVAALHLGRFSSGHSTRRYER